ncbi:hypothetical protein BH09BAC5_BH09BAC5_15170 [soil metagenome]
MKQSYVRIFFIMLTTFAPILAFTQGFGLPLGFELKKFQANETEALYFIDYENACQLVTDFDHVPSSKDFVCYTDKKGWKVVAGTVTEDGFKDESYYFVDAKNQVSVSKKKFDTIQVTAMATALYNATVALKKLNIHASVWKKFMKINLDQTITVWAFPDIDATGNIWYGPECAWYYSSNGKSLVTSKIVNKAPMLAGKSGQILNLSCPSEKMPTIGTIWLAHYLQLKYNEVNITYKTGTSTYHYNPADKTYAWDHTAN